MQKMATFQFLGWGGVRRYAKSPNFALISTLLWFLFLFTAHLPSRQAKQQQTNRQLRKLWDEFVCEILDM